MAEENQHKQIAMVILGIVAVIAVVGLVLMFTAAGSSGLGIYGGAIKDYGSDAIPYWSGNGVPRNDVQMQYASSAGYVPGTTPPNQQSTNWNWNSAPKGSPGDIPSLIVGCGVAGFLVPNNEVYYYYTRGYDVVETADKSGACVYPGEAMVGGIAGQ